MPYIIELPNGQQVQVPDNVPREEAQANLVKKFPHLFPDRDTGGWPAMKANWRSAWGHADEAIGTALEKLGVENGKHFRERGKYLRDSAERMHVPVTDADLEVAKEKGLGAYISKWTDKYITEPTFGSIGAAGPAAAGAAVGALFGPVGMSAGARAGLTGLTAKQATKEAAKKGAMRGFQAPYFAQMTGENIETQREVNPEKEVDMTAASIAGLAQTYLGKLYLPKVLTGVTGMQYAMREAKKLAPAVMEGKITKEAAAKMIGSRAKLMAKEAGALGGLGVATEVGEEAIRRGQAGQDIVGPEAGKHYLETAKHSIAPGVIAGGVHGARARGAATDTIDSELKRWNEEQHAGPDRRVAKIDTIPEEGGRRFYDQEEDAELEATGEEVEPEVVPQSRAKTAAEKRAEHQALIARQQAMQQEADMLAQQQAERAMPPEVPTEVIPEEEGRDRVQEQTALEEEAMRPETAQQMDEFISQAVGPAPEEQLAPPLDGVATPEALMQAEAAPVQPMQEQVAPEPTMEVATEVAPEELTQTTEVAPEELTQTTEVAPPQVTTADMFDGAVSPRAAVMKRKKDGLVGRDLTDPNSVAEVIAILQGWGDTYAKEEQRPKLEQLIDQFQSQYTQLTGEPFTMEPAPKKPRKGGKKDVAQEVAATDDGIGSVDIPTLQGAENDQIQDGGNGNRPDTGGNQPTVGVHGQRDPIPGSLAVGGERTGSPAGVVGGNNAGEGTNVTSLTSPEPEVVPQKPKARKGKKTASNVVPMPVTPADQLPSNTEEDQKTGTKFSKAMPPEERSDAVELENDIKRLFRTKELGPKVHIVQNMDDPRLDPYTDSIDSSSQGFYDPDKDVSFLIADNIPKGKGRSVFFHEVGVHMGLERLLGEKRFDTLHGQVERWATEPSDAQHNQIARRAMQRVDEAGASSKQELVAYMVEESINAGIDPLGVKGNSAFAQWFRSLWAAFKRAMHKLGVSPDMLTAQDLVDAAFGAAKLNITGANHGTAAIFRKFDHGFMSSGEGHQAFGWGSYLAQERGLSNRYRKIALENQDAPDDEVFYDDKSVNENYSDTPIGAVAFHMSQGLPAPKAIARAKRDAEVNRDIYRDHLDNIMQKLGGREPKGEAKKKIDRITQWIADADKEIASFDTLDPARFSVKNPKPRDGQVIRADFNIEDDEWLVLDKPLKEQSDKVKAVIPPALMKEHGDKLGRDYYEYLSNTKGSDKKASMHLDSIGIKGLRFKDAQSRDPKIPTIADIGLKKLAGPVVYKGSSNPYGFAVPPDSKVRFRKDVMYIEVKDLKTGNPFRDFVGADQIYRDGEPLMSREEMASYRDKVEKYEDPMATHNMVVFKEQNMLPIAHLIGGKESNTKFAVKTDRKKPKFSVRPMPNATPAKLEGGAITRIARAAQGVKDKGAKRSYQDWLDRAIQSYVNNMWGFERLVPFMEWTDRTGGHKQSTALAKMQQANYNMQVSQKSMNLGGVVRDSEGNFIAVKADSHIGSLIDAISKIKVDGKQDQFTFFNGLATNLTYHSRETELAQAKKQAQQDEVQARKDLASATTLAQKEKAKKRLAAAEKTLNKTFERPKGVTDQSIKDALQYVAREPEVAKVMEIVEAINHQNIETLRLGGIIDKATAKKWKENKYYVPLYRVFDDDPVYDHPSRGTIGGARTGKIHEFKGSDRDVQIIKNLMEQRFRVVDWAMRNDANSSALKVLAAEGLGGVTRHDVRPNGNNVITVKEKGEDVHYKIEDELAWRTFNGLTYQPPQFMRVVEGFTHAFRELIMLSPDAIGRNMSRDVQEAWIYNYTDKWLGGAGADIFKRFGKGFGGLLKQAKDKDFKLPHADVSLYGVTGAREFTSMEREYARTLQQALREATGGNPEMWVAKSDRAFSALYHSWQNVATEAELASREHIYQQVLQRTGSTTEAMMASINLLDFRRRGDAPIITWMKMAIPFINSQIQGIYKIYRAYKGDNKGMGKADARRAIGMKLAKMMMFATVYSLVMGEDEEYLKIDKKTRDNNLMIPTGVSGLYIKGPLPFEFGSAAISIPQNLILSMRGKQGFEEFKQAMLNILGHHFINPMPQIVKPAVESLFNYDPFTAKNIVPYHMQQWDVSEQARETTTETAKAISAVTGMSPLKADHLVRGYLGSLGQIAAAMTDSVFADEDVKATKAWHRYPVMKSIFTDPLRVESMNSFYTLRDAVDKVNSTSDKIEKEGRGEDLQAYLNKSTQGIPNTLLFALEKPMGNYSRKLSELRRMRNLVAKQPDMDRAQKDRLIEQIRKTENQITDTIMPELKKVLAQYQ